MDRLALVALLGGALMFLGCSDDDGGSGGNGGSAGTGGTGGEFTPTCDTPRQTPPALDDACTAANTNLTNPESCDTTGAEAVTHQLTLLVTERNVSVGFDLDDKVTSDVAENASCIQGGLSRADGGTCSDTTTNACTQDMDCPTGETCNHNGVDNGVAVVGQILEEGELGDLDGLDDALAAAVCLDPLGPVDLELVLAVNAEASCANATLNRDGEDIGTVALNFAEGCLSGSLPDLELAFPGPEGTITATINNTSLAVTADQTMGFAGILSGTAAGDAAVAIAEILNPDAANIVPTTFDILQSLADEPSTACESLSIVLQAGGVADTGAGGAGGNGGAGGVGGSGGAAQ